MSRFAKVTLLSIAITGMVLMLPASVQPGMLIALATAYSVFVSIGVVSWNSPLFGRAITELPSGRGEVALSFDDGPDPESTPALLDLLAEHEAKASFFVVGEEVRRYPEIVARCVREGHSVGNHSNGHRLWTNFMFHNAMLRDLSACQDAILAATGQTATLYRPPFGLRNHATEGVCQVLNLRQAGWSVRALDKPHRSTDTIVERVLSQVRDGSIILLHDGGIARDALVELVTRILDGLAERGLKSVALTAPTSPQ